jgi:phosphonate dehydrogenase
VHARDAVALCFFVPDHIDAAVMDQLPALRILAGFGKGFDNVDVPAATERGIWVTSVSAALTDATADLAWALLLANARGVVYGDARVREYPNIGWDVAAELGRAVTGATIGVYGFGLVGRAIAERSLGFRMNVLYCDPTAAEREVEERLRARRVDAGALLAQADFVVLAVPLNEATYRLIDAEALARMKPTAILVNPARGSIVDEAAVAHALERGALGGYAADVFEHEDRQYASRPTRLLPALVDDRRRTVFTPHLGTAVAADRVALALAQARAVRAVLAGERPESAVNVLGA